MMWIELCTDNLDDWQEAIRIYGEAFAKSDWFVKPTIDKSASVAFAQAYFQYIYETELSDGRAGLMCAKTRRSDGSIAIAYVACYTYNRLPPTQGDTSAMERLSAEMMKDNLEADSLYEKFIHNVIRISAESMDISSLYAVFDATSSEFAGLGVGTKYMMACAEALYHDGLRRGKLPRNKPCVLYGFIEDPKLAKVNRGNQTDLVHFHLSDETVCLKSTNPPLHEESHVDCVVIKASMMGYGTSANILKKLRSLVEKNLIKLGAKVLTINH